MSDEELIEALANRLAEISGPIFADYKPWPKWHDVARECLRQMSWARLNGMIDSDRAQKHNQRAWDLGTRNYVSISLTGDLTLAPPDWKP